MRGSEMITDEMLRKQYYKALVNRGSDFDGIFFAAIKTTGVFCHATCRRENQNLKIVSFTKEQKKLYWQDIARVRFVIPCPIPINYQMRSRYWSKR